MKPVSRSHQSLTEITLLLRLYLVIFFSDRMLRAIVDNTNKYHDSKALGQNSRHWRQRDESDIQRTLRIQNQQTIKRLNQITNNEIVRLAEQANNLDTVPNETAGKSGEVNESEEENWTESSGTEVALRQTANLASDEVGRLQIIDLSSTTALDILKLEIPIDQFYAIARYRVIWPGV
ncbi:hypothetical protein FB192DRAFT_1073899 [Mucor lusitanicus]|uniref:Uncharacterized protein n=1 Tax=Mucor circinelloides f. lusitanicus TaxID=29924 RepID=A0A8H4F1X2_MUCCL|nr:hypothetical protein FB192DRAFT_1073899 [Mucor lusitanicus]